MMGTQRRDFESVAEHLLLCKCPRFSYLASPVKYIKQWTMRKTLPKTLESWCESQKTIPSLTDKWVESSQLFSFSFASPPPGSDSCRSPGSQHSLFKGQRGSFLKLFTIKKVAWIHTNGEGNTPSCVFMCNLLNFIFAKSGTQVHNKI